MYPAGEEPIESICKGEALMGLSWEPSESSSTGLQVNEVENELS